MKIAVLSGKGGTGKTFVSVNLAVTAKKATYIDCDVEEPNGRLFFKPQNIKTEEVDTLLPAVIAEKCIGCRKCVDACRFNALSFIKNKPHVFPEVCHSCGACALVCPSGAIVEIKRPIGVVESGVYEQVQVITGVLNVGEASGVPVIRSALETKTDEENITVIDCPPGSACTVMESVQSADFCILVVEATAFGFHNFKMVYELVSLLEKPCGVVINKADQAYAKLESFCQEKNISVLCRIPYREKLAQIGAKAGIACQEDEETKEQFSLLLKTIKQEVGK
ncbi:MAG: 4Fe-4S dicluster domain-containing protein [Clostridia bacterium]|nr:ATP-binding protein [Anaerotignum sp.]NCC16273.1 4Fe-4S dicluster domain-containing protein [Clostridia bacterium]